MYLFYMIDEKYRNRGYATQCAMELINYAFEKIEYDIIYGGCAKSNVESYKVMKILLWVSSIYFNVRMPYLSLFHVDTPTFLQSP